MKKYDRLNNPKQLVTKFFTMAFVDRNIRQAYESYVSESYIQHNPLINDGRDLAINFLEPLYASLPQRHARIHRVIAEDDHVVVHSLMRNNPSDPGAAHIDIFKVTDGWISEHWDVIQPLKDLGDAAGRF